MDDSPFEEADALGSLRALAEETQEQDDPGDSSKNLIISGLAMGVAAAVIGVVGRWLLRSGWAVRAETPVRHSRHSGGDVAGFLTLAGFGALLVAAVLVIFALVSLAKVVTRRLGK